MSMNFRKTNGVGNLSVVGIHIDLMRAFKRENPEMIEGKDWATPFFLIFDDHPDYENGGTIPASMGYIDLYREYVEKCQKKLAELEAAQAKKLNEETAEEQT